MLSKRYVFFFLFLITFSFLYGQGINEEDSLYNKVILRKEVSGGGIIHNAGWGFLFRKGNNINAFKKRFWEVEFVGMKSPKEIRSINPFFSNSKSYFYGKLNSVFIIRGGMGFQKQLNRKPYWGGVEVRYTYLGGVSLAFAKPVYLYIFHPPLDNYYISIEKYDPEVHFQEYIYGKAPFTEGIGEIKPYPGIYLKGGLNFEFGHEDRKIRALEAGAILDLYPVGIPIMALNDPYNYFLTLYISFSIGKRYNRTISEDKIRQEAMMESELRNQTDQ